MCKDDMSNVPINSEDTLEDLNEEMPNVPINSEDTLEPIIISDELDEMPNVPIGINFFLKFLFVNGRGILALLPRRNERL